MATLYQLAVVAALFVVLSSEGLRVGVVLDREEVTGRSGPASTLS